jgi:hypothetical protein
VKIAKAFRNSEQCAYHRGCIYELRKKRTPTNQYTKSAGDHDDPQQKTADKLATEFGVSAPTIVFTLGKRRTRIAYTAFAEGWAMFDTSGERGR